MTRHEDRIQTKFLQHNPDVLQLHAQKWGSREHQGYTAEILSRSGPHVSS
jgi:hypothetical protein